MKLILNYLQDCLIVLIVVAPLVRPSVSSPAESSPCRVDPRRVRASSALRTRLVRVSRARTRNAPTNEPHKSNVTTLKYRYYETFYTKLNIADSLDRFDSHYYTILYYNKWPASDRFNSSLTR